jgi:hypothetical protein
MRPAVAALNRKAWGLFGLAAAAAVGWFGFNLLAPNLAVGTVPFRLVVTLAVDGIILYGLWRALARTSLSQSRHVAVWVAVALVLAVWIATAWTLAVGGVFRRGIGPVPTLPIAIIVPVVVGSIALTRSRAVGALLDATPASWLVGLQVYRVLGGMFVVYWLRGTLPAAFALPAGIGDVLTGLLALPAALWVATGSPVGRRIAIRWNVLGLIDFAVAITMGMLTSPGPAQLLAREHPNLQIATFPTAMIPAFVVPFSTLLHVLSLRQLKRMRGTAAPATQEPAMASV